MIIDISPPIQVGTPVWPGDTAYQEDRLWNISQDCPVTVSRLTLSSHTGAHADAPSHYDPAGAPVGGLALERYLGPARVVDELVQQDPQWVDVRTVDSMFVARKAMA